MLTRLYQCLALCLLAVVATGCDGPTTLSQRLQGEWIGRPETTAERTVREWPTGPVEDDDPLLVEALADALPTDLEAAAETTVRLQLAESGAAELSLGGERSLHGEWILTPLDGRRAELEITVEEPDDESPEAATLRRRFDIEFLPTGSMFVLSEANSDGRFGRLLFERASKASDTSSDGQSDP